MNVAEECSHCTRCLGLRSDTGLTTGDAVAKLINSNARKEIIPVLKRDCQKFAESDGYDILLIISFRAQPVHNKLSIS